MVSFNKLWFLTYKQYSQFCWGHECSALQWGHLRRNQSIFFKQELTSFCKTFEKQLFMEQIKSLMSCSLQGDNCKRLLFRHKQRLIWIIFLFRKELCLFFSVFSKLSNLTQTNRCPNEQMKFSHVTWKSNFNIIIQVCFFGQFWIHN